MSVVFYFKISKHQQFKLIFCAILFVSWDFYLKFITRTSLLKSISIKNSIKVVSYHFPGRFSYASIFLFANYVTSNEKFPEKNNKYQHIHSHQKEVVAEATARKPSDYAMCNENEELDELNQRYQRLNWSENVLQLGAVERATEIVKIHYHVYERIRCCDVDCRVLWKDHWMLAKVMKKWNNFYPRALRWTTRP